MSAQQTIAEPEPQAAQPASHADYYRRVLHRLIDVGAEFTELALADAKVQARHAAAHPEAGPMPDMSVAYDRYSRAIRRSIYLATKLDEAVTAAATGQPRVAARKRIIRDVEDAIQRECDYHEGVAMREELFDRLDSPDLEDDIAGRPVDDIIADICRDLGLEAPAGTHPWQRRTPEDVADLCARAAKPPVPWTLNSRGAGDDYPLPGGGQSPPSPRTG